MWEYWVLQVYVSSSPRGKKQLGGMVGEDLGEFFIFCPSPFHGGRQENLEEILIFDARKIH